MQYCSLIHFPKHHANNYTHRKLTDIITLNSTRPNILLTLMNRFNIGVILSPLSYDIISLMGGYQQLLQKSTDSNFYSEDGCSVFPHNKFTHLLYYNVS